MFGGAGAEYSSASEGCYADTIINPKSRRKKSKNDKRRFSDEQIRSLEEIFETETKLEPRKKAQLAKELGLQPRQVSIWFQNKRARWKSKQIEKDYGLLLADYNSLASQFESLNKENHSLLIQLQKMKTERVGKSDDSVNHSDSQETTENRKSSTSTGNGGSDTYTSKTEIESNSIFMDQLVGMVDEGNDGELLKMVEAGVECTLTSSEGWGTNLESDDHQWWDSWC